MSHTGNGQQGKYWPVGRRELKQGGCQVVGVLYNRKGALRGCDVLAEGLSQAHKRTGARHICEDRISINEGPLRNLDAGGGQRTTKEKQTAAERLGVRLGQITQELPRLKEIGQRTQ